MGFVIVMMDIMMIKPKIKIVVSVMINVQLVQIIFRAKSVTEIIEI